MALSSTQYRYRWVLKCNYSYSPQSVKILLSVHPWKQPTTDISDLRIFLFFCFFLLQLETCTRTSGILAQRRAHAHVWNSSGTARKLVTQETTRRDDERLSRHALTTAFSRMCHADLIHLPLEVLFRTQSRSACGLLSVSLKERGRAAVDFTSFIPCGTKCIRAQIIVPHFLKQLNSCLKIQFFWRPVDSWDHDLRITIKSPSASSFRSHP